MKRLIDIIEGLKIGSKTKVNKYSYKPKDKAELKKIIQERLKKDKNADLNDIDVSDITDMSNLFYPLNPRNINISEWDVSNVKDMSGMFYGCNNFNSDLSNWDVSNVINMQRMFVACEHFDSDLSKWNVSKVTDMWAMFSGCKKFNCNLNDWNVSNISSKKMFVMFDGCDSLKYKPKWYSFK